VTVSFCADEHVPSVFVTMLRSRGYDVILARSVFGERTNDREMLDYCAEQRHVLLTHDRSDFGGRVEAAVDHAGIVIYTDPLHLRDAPSTAADTLERALSYYDQEDLVNEQIWLDRWRELG